jgi:hypothetical protein
LIGVRSTVLREDRVEAYVKASSEQDIDVARRMKLSAFAMSIDSLFAKGNLDIPECFDFTVYVWEPTAGRLEPIWPPWTDEGEDLRPFMPGYGATGTAWSDGGRVVVKGDAVSNTNYGLSESQQSYWAHHKRAVAYPLYKDLTTKVGVLTALAVDENDFFETAPGAALLEKLANVVGTLSFTLWERESVPGGS